MRRLALLNTVRLAAIAARSRAQAQTLRVDLADRPRLDLYLEDSRWALRGTKDGFAPMPDGLIRFTGMSLR